MVLWAHLSILSIGQYVLSYNLPWVMTMELRLRALREDNDYTQKYISKIIFCDTSLYSKYERGERELPLKVAIKLAQFYQVSLDYLVGLSSEPTTHWD